MCDTIESLKEQIEELKGKIEDLEWENKGIAEWRSVAVAVNTRNKQLEAIIRLAGLEVPSVQNPDVFVFDFVEDDD